MGQDKPQVTNDLPFANLSLQENHDVSRFSASSDSKFVMKDQVSRPSAPSYVENVSSANFINLPIKPRDDPVLKNDQLLTNSNEVSLFNRSFAPRQPPNTLPDGAIVEVPNVSPFELLTLQFPDVSADNLAEVYVTNKCDLDMTFKALNQLQLQGVKRFSDPIFGILDFPSLASRANRPNGAARYSVEETFDQPFSPYRSIGRGSIDFSSAAVRNMTSMDSNIGRNGSPDDTLRASNRGTAGTIYAEMPEEARDHARLCNAYFEKAQQAYLIGNKVLAKEMSMKGQIHNFHMKAANGKVQESLIRPRHDKQQQQQSHNGRLNKN